MNTWTHTRCYRCGRVLPITEVVLRGRARDSYLTGGGSQRSQVEYCRECAAAVDKQQAVFWRIVRWGLLGGGGLLLVLTALGGLACIVWGCVLLVYRLVTGQP
jgi:hypothetical protein